MSSDINVMKLEMRPFVKRAFATGAGNVGGTTLVDATLVEAANFWRDCWVLLRTGTYAGQLRRVTASVVGTLTLDHTVGGQIAAFVQYVMIPPMPVTAVPAPGAITDINHVQVLGVALSAVNPVISGIYDAAGNRMPAMDIAARPGFVDAIDRAARLLGIVYGSQAAQLQQVAGTLELITQDTGLNTNPERWLHDNHSEANQVTVAVAGAPGEQNLGVVVPAGVTRRIRTLNIRHAGTNNTVVTLLISGGAVKDSIDMAPQTTRLWSVQDGAEFLPTEQPAVQTSDVTGGSTYVTPMGVQA